MAKHENNWKHLALQFDKNIYDALQQQHHAAQFIALAGHYLIPQKPDDSNTNMSYVSERDLLVGHKLPGGLRIALKLTDLKIQILDQDYKTQKEITLEGKTKPEVFQELKQNLSVLGVDIANLKNKLHYDIPAHQLDKGAVFTIINENNFFENAHYRNNAQFVIEEVVKSYDKAEPVKVWPHHFDTGSFIPVSFYKAGKLSKSIGLGWGMPDGMVEEPYYYLSFWSEKPIDGLSDLNPLKSGEWKIPGWNGAVLKHSDILKSPANKQSDLVISFFKEGIKLLLDHLK
jgi:hypothetical protein